MVPSAQRNGHGLLDFRLFCQYVYVYYRTKRLLDNPPPGLQYLGRYIDDLIGIWTGPADAVPSIFVDVTDDKHRLTSLTYVIGGDRLEALDLLIKINKKRKLTISLFRKPTDGHQFVHWNSAHPEHLKKSLPYSQLLRIKRNCTRLADFEKEAAGLLKRFRERGYPAHILAAAKAKSDRKIRIQLLQKISAPKKEKEMNRLTFVTGFHPMTAPSCSTAMQFLHDGLLRTPEIKERLPYLSRPFPAEPPRVAFRACRPLGGALGRTYKRGTAASLPILALS